MTLRKLNRVVILVAVVFLAATAGQAITIETVAVGSPGNLGELSGAGAGGWGPDAIVGAVGYGYHMGKYEVTAGQYTEFLNAVAAADPYRLYNTNAWSDDYGCKIERTDLSGNFTYSVAADRADRPVNYVSWYDAARFSNWLTTGNTETGVYTFTNGVLTNILEHETAAATLGCVAWFIPAEDEWYKAAYHKNDGATANYFDYPTASDSEPSNDVIDPDPGNNANFYQNGYTLDSPYWMTEVGEFENSQSPYGTFDQGGNVWEWDETAVASSYGLRGGLYSGESNYLLASSRYYGAVYPPHENFHIGFRVACISAPVIPIVGDLNDDGIVGSHDLDLVRSYWLQSVEPGNGLMGDATGDGLVDSADLDIVRGNWGAGLAAVPEPGVLFLVIGGVVLLVWRRG